MSARELNEMQTIRRSNLQGEVLNILKHIYTLKVRNHYEGVLLSSDLSVILVLTLRGVKGPSAV